MSLRAYIKKQIAPLINKADINQRQQISPTYRRALSLSVSSRQANKDNIYWKSFKRSCIETKSNQKIAAKPFTKKQEIGFYDKLLLVQQSINQLNKTLHRSNTSRKIRPVSQQTSSTRRRQCLESYKQSNKTETLQDPKLVKRQSSNISQKYLKAKLNFNSACSLGSFRIIQI